MLPPIHQGLPWDEGDEYDDSLTDDDALLSQDTANLKAWGLGGLEFTTADESQLQLSKYIRGVMTATISPDQLATILSQFTTNRTGEQPYEAVDITDCIFTLGLPSEVMSMLPAEAPLLSELSSLTEVSELTVMLETIKEVVESIPVFGPLFGWVMETVIRYVPVFEPFITLIVKLGTALVSNNPAALAQALADIGNFVWERMVSFARSYAEFVTAITALALTIGMGLLVAANEFAIGMGVSFSHSSAR